MASVNNNFDNHVDSYLGFLKNEYAVAGISLFLILYAGVIAPKLPLHILAWFDNWIVQVALFFAIVYISNKNATVALITAIAVLVTLMVANNQITLKTVTNAVTAEKFCGSCNNNDDDSDSGKNVFHEMNNVHHEMNQTHHVNDDDDNNDCDNEVDGIIEEHIEEHDAKLAGMHHVVPGGATTSNGGPTESDASFHKSQHHSQSHNDSSKLNIVGVEDHHMNDDTIGSSLDESTQMGSENANANHTEVEHEAPRSAREVVRNVIKNITERVENETGRTIPDDTKKVVMSEVATKVANMARKRPVGEFDVISVCREVYRRHL